MHKADKQIRIKILLLQRGITQVSIAKQTGVSPVAVSNVISGQRVMPWLRAVVAEACGVPVEELWPEEANRPEDPRCKRCRHKRSTAGEETACQATTC